MLLVINREESTGISVAPTSLSRYCASMSPFTVFSARVSIPDPTSERASCGRSSTAAKVASMGPNRRSAASRIWRWKRRTDRGNPAATQWPNVNATRPRAR